MNGKRRPSDVRWVVLAVLALTIFPGCVRRRLTVRTSQPGAKVYVDRQPIGLTPVSDYFTYYGTRHIEIVKDGYKTESFLRTFRPPWYQWPGIDFFAESVWPFEVRDERILDVELTPEPVVAPEALLGSAEALRLQAQQGLAVGAPPTTISDSYTWPAGPGPYRDPTLPPGGTMNQLPGQVLPPPPAWSTGPLFSGSPVLPPGVPAAAPFWLPPPSAPVLNVTPGNSYRPIDSSPSMNENSTPAEGEPSTRFEVPNRGRSF
jgi:hypothetical protein